MTKRFFFTLCFYFGSLKALLFVCFYMYFGVIYTSIQKRIMYHNIIALFFLFKALLVTNNQ